MMKNKKLILGLLILAVIGIFLVIGAVLISMRQQKQAGISATQEELPIEESDVNQFLQLNFTPFGHEIFFDGESANHYYFTWNGASEDYYSTWNPINFQCEDFENPFIGIELQSLDNSDDVKLSVEFDSKLWGRGYPTDVSYDWETIHGNKKEHVFMNNHYILRCDYPYNRMHLLKIKVDSSESACGEYKFKIIFKGPNSKKTERTLTVGVGCDFLTSPVDLPEEVKPYVHGCYNERSHFIIAGYGNNSFINPADSRINEIIETYILNEPASTTEELVEKVFNFVRDYSQSPTGISFSADVPDFALAEYILNNGYFEGTCSQHAYLSVGLLRNLGIPARMVYFIFTNKRSDHSAVEVWIPGKGWKIYDSAMHNLFDETFYQWYFGHSNNVLYAFAGVVPSRSHLDTGFEGCDKENMAKYKLFTVDRSSAYSSKDINLGISRYHVPYSAAIQIKLKWVNMDLSNKISELKFYIKNQVGNTLELQPINPEDTLGCDSGIKVIDLEQTQELEEFMDSEIRKTQYIVEYNGQQHITSTSS